MTATVSLTVECDRPNLPTESQFLLWAKAALHAAEHHQNAEISLSIVSNNRIRELNSTYREKDKATNVLSFPADLHPSVDIPLLGDIVFAPEVIETEAAEQAIALLAHWAHMTVHGTLHLLGFDHIEDQDALVMEALEIKSLDALGYTNPYLQR